MKDYDATTVCDDCGGTIFYNYEEHAWVCSGCEYIDIEEEDNA